MFVLEHLWIIPLLPLLGAAANGLFGRGWPRRAINAVALGTTGLAALATAELAREFARLDAAQIPWTRSYFTWIVAGNFRADYALQVDSLTLVMLLVVTGVGLLIHIYSIGYMADEGGYYRFFAYLNLFMFFMLTLVLAANYLLMFVGWEGVGLCSYLLIGFYFLKKTRHRCRQQGIHRQPHRRLRLPAGAVSAVPAIRLAGFCRGLQRRGRHARGIGGRGRAHRRRAAAAGRRDRQVRADSAVRLAARRHGRPHAGLRADPRGDHGDRGRVHGRALARSLPARADGHDRRRRRSAASPRSWRPPSRWCRPTSRRCSPTPPSASSATCFWPAASARSPPASFT